MIKDADLGIGMGTELAIDVSNTAHCFSMFH
jgi:hypothetical protein